MENYGIRLFNVMLGMVVVIAAALAAAGCAKENLDDCDITYSIKVRAYDADAAEVSAGVNDVILYVFDDNHSFVKEIETTAGTTVRIEAPEGGHINVVAWGNLKGGNQIRHTFNQGHHVNTGYVSLKTFTARAITYYMSPDDLFMGSISILKSERKQEKLLPIHRKTGSMNITVRNIKEHSGLYDDDFRIEVRETHNRLDFNGSCAGAKDAAYRPAGLFATNTQTGREEFLVPTFNLLPESGGIDIDIYHGDTLIETVSSPGGKPITVKEGLLTNVLIDFSANLSVSVVMTPWGMEQLWKEYGS